MNIEINPDDFEPLIERVVGRVLDKRAAASVKLGNQLSFSEPKAAALLDVKPHALRDARYRGEIAASKVGSRVVYRREDYPNTTRYLASHFGMGWSEGITLGDVRDIARGIRKVADAYGSRAR